MKKYSILFFIAAINLVYCTKINKLTKEDFEWIPYRGNEILVFNSNIGNTDTIFLLKKDTLIAYPEAQMINGLKYELISIFCKHTNFLNDANEEYSENVFIELRKSKDNHADLKILLSAKGAKFYRLNSIKIDSLSKNQPVTFQTKYKKYTDVYIINAEDYLGYSNQPYYITKLYWSKSQGLIRVDKNDSVYWELEKSYSDTFAYCNDIVL